MSRSVTSDRSWNSTDDDFDDIGDPNSSGNSNRRVSGGDELPGGVVTTHSVAAVIRPEKKAPRTDPLQFVKISTNELSKKAVEQIKLAEEVKITKEKIKEVEEEWQNNLLNWKSKRRQSKNSCDESLSTSSSNRKIKTFSEILNEKAKSGHRIGYNLHKYLGDAEFDDDGRETKFDIDNNNESTDNQRNGNSKESLNSIGQRRNNDCDRADGDRFKPGHGRGHSGLGDVIVFDTSMLEEFSYNKQRTAGPDSECSDDRQQQLQVSNEIDLDKVEANQQLKTDRNNGERIDGEQLENDANQLKTDRNRHSPTKQGGDAKGAKQSMDDSKNGCSVVGDNDANEQKTKVEIKNWKLHDQRENVLQYLLQQEQHQQQQQKQQQHQQAFVGSESDDEELSHNNSYEAEDDDEEMERLRLEQEKSFKAKLSAFENLSKAEEAAQKNLKNAAAAKQRDGDGKRRPPAVDQLLQSEQNHSQPRGSYDHAAHLDLQLTEEEQMNLRIQQLHLERQRAQDQVQRQQIYQANPHQQQSQRQFDQQQYYLMDEVAGQKAVGQQQQQQQQQQHQSLQPQPSTGRQPKTGELQPTQEHLYVNQKQLLMHQAHPQFYDQLEQPVGARDFDPVTGQKVAYPNFANREYFELNQQQQAQSQPNYPQQPGLPTTVANNQYLYYPKPYNKQQPAINQKPMVKPTPKPAPAPINQRTSSLPVKPAKNTNANQQQQNLAGYNRNHWLVQEAELRRQLANVAPIPPTVTVPPAGNQPAVVRVAPPNASNGQTKSTAAVPGVQSKPGMLSVSGRKKCSSCGDDLGRGCAAMVVESLSLYYHINCFRCSVCHIQLGNGTVGTDVRVRNHKLHCQNCYSNDEELFSDIYKW